ncbi:MAG: type III-A CRISPR-associated RAMP protein Csm3 [Elusimicrobiota bacterium]
MECRLLGKLIIEGEIEAKTGIRVGGPQTGLKISGVDLSVIRDPWGKPYVPGSSIKGKLRSLLEHSEDCRFEGGKHECRDSASYRKCPSCRIFGVAPGGAEFNVPSLTRLMVSDAYLLNEAELKQLHEAGNLELELTEVKAETAIDRVQGKARSGGLRQVERVPAGARFGLRLVLNVYSDEDKPELVPKIFKALSLLEDDYLGGMGSRGYGRVKVGALALRWNSAEDYQKGSLGKPPVNEGLDTPQKLVSGMEQVLNRLA